MKLILSVISAILILTSCVRQPEDVLTSLEDVGITYEGDTENQCIKLQLAAIAQDIEELDLEQSLKLTAHGSKVKKVILTNKESGGILCKRVKISEHHDKTPDNCDPKTISGAIVDLGDSQVEIAENGEVIHLVTYSQKKEMISIIYQIADFLIEPILNEVYNKTEQRKYIDVNVFENASRVQSIFPSQESRDTLEVHCSNKVSISSIIEALNEIN
mgnify:CR=1 FL=1